MILTFIVEEFLINLTVIVEEVLITLTFMVEEVLTFNLVIPDIIEIDNLDILELELLITLTFVLETFFINPKDLLGDRQNSLLTSGWGGRCMVSYLNSKHVVFLLINHGHPFRSINPQNFISWNPIWI
jgi:hypothetical protein